MEGLQVRKRFLANGGFADNPNWPNLTHKWSKARILDAPGVLLDLGVRFGNPPPKSFQRKQRKSRTSQ